MGNWDHVEIMVPPPPPPKKKKKQVEGHLLYGHRPHKSSFQPLGYRAYGFSSCFEVLSGSFG